MTDPPSSIRADFDRIAALAADGWDHNAQYHRLLLKQMPRHCRDVLEIGCGAGTFTRLMAARADRVVALDLSPKMIRAARQRLGGHPNVEFHVADATACPFPTSRFDGVVSIATLHHLRLEPMLTRMKEALRPGGTLLVLDLFEPTGPWDMLMSALAVPANLALTFIKTGRFRPPRAVREAWDDHGRHETYPTMAEIRRVCGRVLPNATVRRHLLWRYSIVWRRDERAA